MNLAEIKARAERATAGPWSDEDGKARGKADDEFIAHARTDIPELVAEVERLSLIESNLVQEIVRTSIRTAEQVGVDVAEMVRIIALMQTAEVERLQAEIADLIDDLDYARAAGHVYTYGAVQEKLRGML